jgi:ParB family chromosome partitioning protein
MLMENKIDMGHARALLPLDDSAQQLLLANKIVLESMSVRDAEKLVQKATQPQEAAKPKIEKQVNRDTQLLEEEMSSILGAKVEIKQGKKGSGKLVLEYSTLDQLEEFINKLRNKILTSEPS